jgi:hypothetical protein
VWGAEASGCSYVVGDPCEGKWGAEAGGCGYMVGDPCGVRRQVGVAMW